MELFNQAKYKDEKYFGYYDPRHRLSEEDIQSLTEDGVNWLLMTAVNMELAEGRREGLSSEDLQKRINQQWKFCQNWIKADSLMRDWWRESETTDL